MKFSQLTNAYLSDEHSPFKKVRYATSVSYRRQIARLNAKFGDSDLISIGTRSILDAHVEWTHDGEHVSMAHSLATMLRGVISFGATVLEDAQCQRLQGLLAGLRFKTPKRRTIIITLKQVATIRDVMTVWKYYGMALACAVQSDCGLRQKDVIGEWIPADADQDVPAIATETDDDGKVWKWVRGITREEIDGDLILTHKTSKRGQVLVFDLKKCPAVQEEWFSAPPSGPLIVDPETGLPYHAWKFRRLWRSFATMSKVPQNVWNMDARAGRITALFDKGVSLEDVRKFAGHEHQSDTLRYSRDSDQAIERALTKARDPNPGA
jgi:hypothetical protein